MAGHNGFKNFNRFSRVLFVILPVARWSLSGVDDSRRLLHRYSTASSGLEASGGRHHSAAKCLRFTKIPPPVLCASDLSLTPRAALENYKKTLFVILKR